MYNFSSSNLAEVRGWTLLILEVRGQRSRSQLIQYRLNCVYCIIKLGRFVNPIGLEVSCEGHNGYHWQMWGALGCYALRCYILFYFDMSWQNSKLFNWRHILPRFLFINLVPLPKSFTTKCITRLSHLCSYFMRNFKLNKMTDINL